jgi:KDO2-lipid IV(A) lauroyltransferase
MIKFLATWFRQLIIWPLGAVLIHMVMGLRFIVPVHWSSAIIGGLVRVIGPWTSWHRRARKNLRLVMPELTPAQERQILNKMWWNIGRNAGEFAYLENLAWQSSQHLTGDEILDDISDTGGFIISGHLGNWEMCCIPFIRRDLPFSIIYRPLNNPLAKNALNKRLELANKTYSKGRESARGIIETARKKDIMIILVDQKLREGMVVPFFGKGVTTPVSYIKAALNHDIPIIMMRIRRSRGCQFSVSLEKLDCQAIIAKNPNKDPILAIATEINAFLEEWIRETPEQWFWPHRRWPESKGEVPYEID